MYVYETLIIAFGSYLIGSIPFGIVLAKLFGLPDPRTIGSKNIGATNMLRTGNKKVALLTLLLDAGKGALAVVLTAAYVAGHDALTAQALQGNPQPHEALALLMAALGHMYSPWLKFKGGKGVATVLGGVLALSPIIGLMFCLTWLLVFIPTRYVSFASILALGMIPVCGHFVLDNPTTIILAIAALVAIWKHHANIARLRAGTEPKMGGKKNA
jgi:glycerol-3-phosphate acyltransferase PlsY